MLLTDKNYLKVSIAAFGMLFGCVTSGPIAQWVRIIVWTEV